MNQKHMKQLLIVLVILLGLGVVALTGTAEQERIATGIVSLEQQAVKTQVAGTIKKIYIAQGDAVRAGDVLYEIDSQELSARIAQAQQVVKKIEDDIRSLSTPTATTVNGSSSVNVSAQESAYQSAQAQAAKFEALYAQGAISKKMLQEAQANRDMLYQALLAARASGQETTTAVYGAGNPTVLAMKQEELAHAKKQLADLEAQQAYLIVTSPANGIVSNQIYQEGARVENGYLLANIAIKENCILSAYITDAQKNKLVQGQEVAVHIAAYDDKNFDGIVETIGGEDTSAAHPSGEAQTLVQIRMTNTDGLLRAGMQAEIYTK